MRPDGGRSRDVRTQDVGALVGVASPLQDPGGTPLLSPVEQALRLERGRAANLLLKRACETRDPAQGETNGAAMASGARNRRGQDDARMCVLTRGTGARRGAKDPGAKTPWWAAIHQSRQLHCPEPGKNDRYGAREDAHSGSNAGQELPHGASHAPRSLMPMRERTTASRTAKPVRRRNHV